MADVIHRFSSHQWHSQKQKETRSDIVRTNRTNPHENCVRFDRLTIFALGASIPTNKQKLLKPNLEITTTMTPRRSCTNKRAEEDGMNGFSHEMADKVDFSVTRTGRILGTFGSSDRPSDDVYCENSATPSTKSKSEEKEDDVFVPHVLEVAPRTRGFDSKDPLFGGICLYSGTMASERREELESRPGNYLQKNTVYFRGRLSWLFPGSIFSNHGA